MLTDASMRNRMNTKKKMLRLYPYKINVCLKDALNICKRKEKTHPLYNGVNTSQIMLLLNYTSSSSVLKITISLQISLILFYSCFLIYETHYFGKQGV